MKTGKKSKKPQLNFQKWFNQAIYFHQVGRLREAESIYKKMIAAGSSDPAVFCNLGILCKNSGRLEQALKYYEQALDFDPDDPSIYSNIGNLCRDIGNLDQALQLTLRALELAPDSSTVLVNLGCIYRDLGETDQALIATVKAIDIDESNIEARQNLKSLASDIKINELNSDYATKAYETLLNSDDFLIASCAHFLFKNSLNEFKQPPNWILLSQTATLPFMSSHQIGDSENL